MAHIRTVNRATGARAFEVRWLDAGRDRQRTFKVKREAERFALKVENDLAAGQSTDPLIRRGPTVADVVEEVLATARTRLKPRSVRSYEQGYTRYILPTFGPRRIAQVSSADVERWVADLHSQGLSAGTVRNQFVALNKVFRHATRHRYIAANPCTGTPLPRTPHSEAFHAVFLSAPEVEKLANELAETPPYDLLVRFAAYTGLRAGEMTGLRLRDVNLLRGEVSVTHTLQRIAGEWQEGSPKSARSTRVVPVLNPALLADLGAYVAAHPHRQDADARLWPGRAPGGASPTQHTRLDWSRPADLGGVLKNYIRPALRRAGLPEQTRLHDLRHTYASLMFAAGVEPYKVSRWLGHASLATTDGIYAHLYVNDHSADANRVAAFLAASSARSDEATVTRLRQVF